MDHVPRREAERWRPGTQSCRGASSSAGQKEALERQGRARPEGAGEQVASCGATAPGPAFPTTLGPASSGGASETAGPSHTDHPTATHKPTPSPASATGPPHLCKQHPNPWAPLGRGSQRMLSSWPQAVTQAQAATPGLQGTRAPPGPQAWGQLQAVTLTAGPMRWPGSS